MVLYSDAALHIGTYSYKSVADEEDEEDEEEKRVAFICQCASTITSIAAFENYWDNFRMVNKNQRGRQPGSKTIVRLRIDMDKYVDEMDVKLFRRKYRMEKSSFYTLLDIIEPHMRTDGLVRSRGATPNGTITHASRLSMSLRYFAGGDPLDISCIHGVKDGEVLVSVWDVVDAIHKSSQLDIVFPESHAQQLEIARGFEEKSTIGISNCVGAIDGILIWTNKPSTVDEEAIKFGPAKFFCGRKKKFGLNMQATCDADRKFLDVEIKFPGAASDYYAFDESALKQKLERPGFLRPGLCLFGDNAYVQTPYMCTPFRNVSAGDRDRDAYNFFQSQVRINVECAFGLLVHRWGILRKPIAVNISVQKTTSLVLALCKLHNFCIAQRDIQIEQTHSSDIGTIVVINGGLYLPRVDACGDASWEYDVRNNSLDRLTALMDGGDHRDDHTQNARRKFRRNTDLPCFTILQVVKNNNYQRPARN